MIALKKMAYIKSIFDNEVKKLKLAPKLGNHMNFLETSQKIVCDFDYVSILVLNWQY